MTTKALHGTLFAAALAAIGGTANAQPVNPDALPPEDPHHPTDTDTSKTPAPVDTTPSAVTPPVVIVEPPPPPAPTTTVVEVPPDHRNLYERYGIGVALGGGVEGYAMSGPRDQTTDGGNWDVRLTMGTRSPLAIEAAYIGSAQSINTLGLSNNAVLVGNGAQADARLNLTDTLVQPFFYGGVAWKRYSITNSSQNTSDLIDNDDVLEIPLGVGVAAKYAGLMLDLRGEYRLANQDDLFAATPNSDRADRWGVNANVGLAF
jgi:hypothetical protein